MLGHRCTHKSNDLYKWTHIFENDSMCFRSQFFLLNSKIDILSIRFQTEYDMRRKKIGKSGEMISI